MILVLGEDLLQYLNNIFVPLRMAIRDLSLAELVAIVAGIWIELNELREVIKFEHQLFHF